MNNAIINLTSGFAPMDSGMRDPLILKFRNHTFSGGEVNVSVSVPEEVDIVTITARLASAHDVMRLVMMGDAVRRQMPKGHLRAFFPYVPYARQDRVCHDGEAFGLEVFANLVNSVGFDAVMAYDPHSPVTAAKIRNFVPFDNCSLVRKVIEQLGVVSNEYIMVGPDSGSAKKIDTAWKSIPYALRCDAPTIFFKQRSLGGIDSIECALHDFGNVDAVIVDDICDGGRTFVKLAEKLRQRNVRNIYLIVSHAIFSYGLDPMLQAGIKHIFTTDSVANEFSDHPNVTFFKLESLLNG